MPISVSVVAAARLHLGFLDMNGALGRKFGGLGLSIDAPATRLTLRAGRNDGGHGRRRRARPRAARERRRRARARQALSADDRARRFRRIRASARARSWRWPSPPRCAASRICRRMSRPTPLCCSAARAPGSAPGCSRAAGSSSTAAAAPTPRRRRSSPRLAFPPRLAHSSRVRPRRDRPARRRGAQGLRRAAALLGGRTPGNCAGWC